MGRVLSRSKPLTPCHVRPSARAGLMPGYANLDVRQIFASVRSLQSLIHSRMPMPKH